MTRVITEDSTPDRGSRLPELREALMSEEGLKHISRLVTIGELALCFSHEVRNPLTTLTGHAYMAQQALPEGDPLRIHLDNVYRNSMRMKGMIDSMLDFGRRREKTTDRCSPEELIHEAARVTGPYFEDFKRPPITVQVEVEPACPKVAVARWEMIHVLVNLMTNAADAMSQSRQRLVTVSARRERDGVVRISVADTGAGIAPEDVGRVFSPFFTTKGERGNGLGLFIVRSTIEHHGGSIALQTGSSGTVFTICLPTC
jgi:signal transduction histidine kinase